jgi:hypothetical protein
MSEKTGTFVVAEADAESAILRDAEDGQVHTLSENPGVEAGQAVVGTVAPEPPMEVTWELLERERSWHVEFVRPDLQPTRQAREVATDQAQGEVERIERAGEGELHVLAVPDPQTAADDVLDDDGTLERAAKLGAVRVEVRTGEGMISVRYLPD